MWQLGLLTVITVAFDLTSSAAIGHGAPLQRLKRSPPFCPPYFPPPHHPPFWPPPPPPYFYRHGYGHQDGQHGHGQAYQGEGQSNQGQYGQAQTHQEEFAQGQGNQGGQFEQSQSSQGGGFGQKQAYSDAGSQANSQNEGHINFPTPPCDKCDKGNNTAISNAQSETGSAIAVAISGKKN